MKFKCGRCQIAKKKFTIRLRSTRTNRAVTKKTTSRNNETEHKKMYVLEDKAVAFMCVRVCNKHEVHTKRIEKQQHLETMVLEYMSISVPFTFWESSSTHNIISIWKTVYIPRKTI